MKLLFLGNLAAGEIIIIFLILLLPLFFILLICGAFSSFPPDPQTLDTSRWRPIAMKIWNGIILYLIADAIGALFDLFDKIQDLQSLFSSSSPEDFLNTWMSNSIDIFSGATLANIFAIIGFLMYYIGLGEFSGIQEDNTTAYKTTRVRSAAIYGIVAIVIDYIPLIGSVASWLTSLIMYFTMASAFGYLKFSPVFNTKAKAGASLLKTASIMYIIGMFIPFVGSIFNCLGFFMTIIGWGRIANGGPIASGFVTQPQYPTQPAAYTPPVPKSSPYQEDTETILDQHWMFCSKCSLKCKDYLKFCPRCGFALHPEREELASDYSSYASSVTLKQPETDPSPQCESKPVSIPVMADQPQPLVTNTGGVIHVENTVHPTVESHPEPLKVGTEAPQSGYSKHTDGGNKKWMWSLIVLGILLAATIPAYLLWYKPYAIDRDAPRYYTFTNLNLRSSMIADVDQNLLGLLPYGTELITYSITGDWANVKANGQKGFVSSNLILTSSDFVLLNNTWGNTDAKECIGTSKCRLAVLDYYKRFNLSGGAEWQIYTRKKEDRVNNVFYKRLYTSNSKFTDFAFIVKNNRTKERELVLYSFDDETEKPIFRKTRRLYPHETGNIQSMTSTARWIDNLLTDGAWIQIEITGQ